MENKITYQLPEGYSGRQIAFFDCSKDYDDDTFFQNEGVKVRKTNLGEYREATDKPHSRFGYRFKINDTSKPHMLVAAYPDDKRRHIMINDCFSYDLSVGAVCGGEFEVSNTVKKINRVFYSRTNDVTVVFTTWGEREPAAAFGFAVYELDKLVQKETKPDYDVRSYGIQYEDPCGVMSDLGVWLFEDWQDRLIDYMKHTGQNRIVQPINWYAGPVFNSECQPGGMYLWASLPNHTQYTISSTAPNDWVSDMLDKCEENGIEFVGGMTLLRLGNLLKNMNIDLEDIYNGGDTYNNMRYDNMVQTSCNDWTLEYNALNMEKLKGEGRKPGERDGFEWMYGEKFETYLGRPMFNPLHPEVQRQVIEYIEEISRRYGNKKAFKGISINLWHSTLLWYSSLEVGYDDYTIKLFTEETGIEIPVDIKSPTRFGERYNYIMKRIRDIWVNWRCRKIYEYILKIRDALQKYNSELTLCITVWNEPVKRTMHGEIDSAMQYPAFFAETDFLKNGGIDLDLLKNTDGISVSVEQNQHRDRGWSTKGGNLPAEEQRFFHDISYLDNSWSDVLKMSDNCGAFVMDSWEEIWGKVKYGEFDEHNPDIDSVLGKVKFGSTTFFSQTCEPEPDEYWYKSQRQITSCYPPERYYLEPIAHAIAEFDPLCITRGGLYLDMSHSTEISEYTAAFTKLPKHKFDDVAGSGDPITVRKLDFNGKTYFYAVNREPYAIRLSININGGGIVKNIGTGKEYAADDFETVIDAFGLLAFEAEGIIKIVGYDVDIPNDRLKSIKEKYSKQIECFDLLKAKGKEVYGINLIRDELCKAMHENKVARVRHLLNSYVCLKSNMLNK